MVPVLSLSIILTLGPLSLRSFMHKPQTLKEVGEGVLNGQMKGHS